MSGEFDIGPALRIEERIDAHEGEAVLDRWEFGRWLFAQRNGAKQLPDGLLAQLVENTGKSQAELRNRAQFYSEYPSKDEVANALATYKSWYEIVNGGLGSRGDKTTAERLVASDENEWYTPAKYVEAARKVLGGIDLDPASCEAANETVRAGTIYTIENDGLDHVWEGRVWLNPPYGRLAGDFVGHLVSQFEAGNVTAAVALVNAHCTDTSWFQRLWGATLCFTDHRIDFDSGDRSKTSTSTHGSVFAYLGTEPAKFAEAFAPFGAVVRRWQP